MVALVGALAMPVHATTINVTGTADESSSSLPNVICTLREAVIAANTNAAVGAGLAANCPATDQRGIARPMPASGSCDVGAYEASGCGASLSVAGAAPVALVRRRRRRR